MVALAGGGVVRWSSNSSMAVRLRASKNLGVPLSVGVPIVRIILFLELLSIDITACCRFVNASTLKIRIQGLGNPGPHPMHSTKGV